MRHPAQPALGLLAALALAALLGPCAAAPPFTGTYPLLALRAANLTRAHPLTRSLPLPKIDLALAAFRGPATDANFRPAVVAAIAAAVPQLNAQLAAAGKPGLPAGTTAQSLADNVLAALGAGPSLDRRLARRAPGPAACNLFAAGALPGYLAAASWFFTRNLGGPYVQGLTDDQLFFVRAVDHVPVPAGVLVYNAKFAPGFTKSAVTMDNFIYFNGKKGLGNAPLDNGTGIGKWLLQPDFHARTRLLTHELIHVRQYDAAGSGIVPFAYNYLYTFCTNGFKYASIPYEAQAKQIQLTSDPILWPPSHFKVWKGRGLKAALGFPTSATLTKGRMEFEKGVLEVHPSDTAKINRRFRYFVKGTPAYATYMAGACSPKTVLPPTSKACKSDDPPDACDPDWVAEYNKQCAAKQPPTTGEFAYQVM